MLRLMIKQFTYFLVLLPLVFSVSAQTDKATKIDEFGYLDCDNLMMRVYHAFLESKKVENSKIYVIYYEGKHLDLNSSVYDKKAGKYERKFLNPRRGDALRRANDIRDYLTNYSDFSDESLVFADGGYRNEFSLEIWILPKGAELPKSTPTLREREVKFRKGKSFKARNCITIYDGL